MQNNNKVNRLALAVLAGALFSAAAANADDVVTTNTFSGYVKMDVLFNSENDASGGLREQALLTLNADEAKDEEGELYMSAWESRLNFTSKSTGTPVGDLKAVIEGDMYSGATQNVFNLRHAYLQQNNLTIGQTWSTFMDLGALAETADFGGPAARIFTRQPLVRYSVKMGDATLDLAAEKPKNSVDPVMPDLVVNYTTKTSFGHLSAGLLAQQLNDDDGTKDDSAMALAARFSGRINLGGDNLKFSVISGQGLGGYMNFGDVAAYDFSGDKMELSTQTGFKLAYQHVFSDTLRSTLRYAQTTSEIDGIDMGDFSSIHANLVYNPYKPLSYGAEVVSATKAKAEGNALTEDRKLSRLHLFAKLAF
ncbi:DcaP family trimeric outer membrane transporter [Thalassolituus sp. LLYu03]|uniref:DcaP family trimeric outer membrane transporter n=1 Tax=Thalassolituus sp. LLYu03 TaxID=3421656 RepID=UPI003D296934